MGWAVGLIYARRLNIHDIAHFLNRKKILEFGHPFLSNVLTT